jgi:hypothetical protein
MGLADLRQSESIIIHINKGGSTMKREEAMLERSDPNFILLDAMSNTTSPKERKVIYVSCTL